MTTETVPEELIKINVYRPLDGIRTPYTLSLDRMRNLVGDEIDHVELEAIMSNPYRLARHRIAQPGDPVLTPEQQLLAENGLSTYVTDRGIVISRKAPDEWSEQYAAWLDDAQPNPFEGTDEVRDAYRAERDETQSRVDAGQCKGCELNRLKVEYRIKLRQAAGL